MPELVTHAAFVGALLDFYQPHATFLAWVAS
jgi:hypothetical protein